MSAPRASRSNQVLFDSAVLDSILPFLHDRGLLSLGLVCRSFNVYLRYSKGAELTEARWRCERNRTGDPHSRMMRRSYDGDGSSDPESCPSWSRAVSAVGVVVHTGSSMGKGQRQPALRIPRASSATAVDEADLPVKEGIWDSFRKWFSPRGKPPEHTHTSERAGRSRDPSRGSRSSDGEDSDNPKSRDSSPSLEAPWWRLEQHQVDDWKDSLGASSPGSLPSTPTRRIKEPKKLSTKEIDSLYRKKLERDESTKSKARRAESPRIPRDVSRVSAPSSLPSSTPIAISQEGTASSRSSYSPSSLSYKPHFAPHVASSLKSSSYVASSLPSSIPSSIPATSTPPPPSSSPPTLATAFPFVSACSSSCSASSSSDSSISYTNSSSSASASSSSASSCLSQPSSLSTSVFSPTPLLDSPTAAFPSFESMEEAEDKRVEVADRRELVKLPEEPERDLTFWNEIVLDRWSIVKDSPLVVKIWDRDGVPASMRGAVWALAIGNVAEVGPDAYFSIRRQIEEQTPRLDEGEEGAETPATPQAGQAPALPAGWVSPSPKPTLPLPDMLSPARTTSSGRPRVLSPRHSFGNSRTDSIDADLLRMFPKMKHSWMEKTGSLWCNLRQLLQALCSFRPDISYIQGMSYLAAVFLVYMPPEKAFVCLVNLIRRDYFPSYMQMDALNIRVRFQVFEAVFEANLPNLFRKFGQDNLLPDCYLMEWLLTIFSKQLPLDIVSRIWDNYLLHGEVFIFKVACSLLMIQQPRLIDKTANECMRTLRGTFPDVTEQQVLTATSQVVIPASVQGFYERRKTNPDYCEFEPLVIHAS